MPGRGDAMVRSVEDARAASPGSRGIARNIVWNQAGYLVPVLVALGAVPVLVDALGSARFGVLTLIWAVVGYFTLFDFGLGRALTQRFAAEGGSGAALRETFWTFLWFTMALGLLAGVALAVATQLAGAGLLNLEGGLADETRMAAWFVAAAMALSVSTPGVRGVLEARGRFALVAALRGPSAAALVASPLAVLPFSHSLAAIAAALFVVRVATWVAHLVACLRVVPALGRPLRPRPRALRSVAAFAGWVSVSNVVAPVMGYLDRFVIAAAVSATAVAYYAAPHEAITKLGLASLAFAGVLFPVFAAASAAPSRQTKELLLSSSHVLLALLFLPTLVTVAFAHELLDLWLGEEFADAGTFVLQLLAVGVLVNSVAQIPFGLVQAFERPDLTAKLHLAEVPLYISLLIVSVKTFGIDGAALMWLVRAAADAVLLFAMAWRILGRGTERGYVVLALVTVAILAALAVLGFVDMPLGVRLVAIAVLAPLGVAAALATAPEAGRAALRRRLAAVRPRAQPTTR